MGVRLHNLESDFLAFVIPWGRYLDTDKCRVGVSSWRRPGSNLCLSAVQTCGGYINSAFAKTEAHDNGYDEAIVLERRRPGGGRQRREYFPGEDGKLVTPSIYENILVGITRRTVMELAAKELGIEVLERPIERTELYIAEEAFFTGTAAHISPICRSGPPVSG